MERKTPQYTKCDIEMEKLKKGWIQKIIDKTNFICLAELSTYEIKDNNSNSINNISY